MNILVLTLFNVALVVCLCVCPQVAEGQEICVIEAMKMQNSLTAVKQAKVTTWNADSKAAV